jgi:two-component system, NarL family, sensor histidine kinase UhpB
MRMSRYLITRLVAVSAAILLAGLGLALWRAQYDVQREERGALEIVRLFEHLYAIENGPAAEVDAHVEALRRINDEGRLRHIQLDLRDAAGTLRVAPRDSEPSGAIERAFALIAPGMRSVRVDPSGPWTLQRDDDARFVATLSLDPSSEQREALDNLVGMLLVLLGYGTALLLAVYWALRRTLAPLQPIQQAIGRYERDDFAYRLPSLPFAEMDRIGGALNHLAATLSSAQETRRALSLKLVSSQEEERARIARELHDELGQLLTALKMDLSWLREHVAQQPEVAKKAAEMNAMLDQTVSATRRISADLRPLMLDDLGLADAAAWLVDEFGKRSGVGCDYRQFGDGALEALSKPVATTVYRALQESLTNIGRHSGAKHAWVVLGVENGVVSLEIEDDGRGIAAADIAKSRSLGLKGMRERVTYLGGAFEVGRAARGGTRVRVSVPPQAAPEAKA